MGHNKEQVLHSSGSKCSALGKQMGWLSHRELSTDWSGPLLTPLIRKIKRMGENKDKKEEEKGERRKPEKAELLSKCAP